MDDLVLIGIIRKVRGNKGDLKVESMSDFPERFSGLERVLIRKRNSADAVNFEIDKSEYLTNYAVMRLKGINSYDEAAAFVGAEVLVPESESVALPDGTFYIHTLIGMNVKNVRNERLGIVEDVLSGSKQSILLVRMQDGTELDLPFAGAFVKNVDVEGKEITVELIEGMVEKAEINAGEKRR